MAHVTMPLATMMMVAASTIHPPQATWGTKSRISTRKARSDTRSVGKVKISSASKYRGEWAGEWKWAATASPKQISVMKAATGCTIRMDERAWRELAGSEKSVSGWSWNSVSASHGQLQPLQAHLEQHTSVIAYHRPLARAAIGAVTQHTKVDVTVGRNGNRRDDGRRDGREQQQTEGDKEQYG
jgi:hypothetical protein